MSLSITLVPLAIAASSAVAYALQGKIEEGTYYKIDTKIKDEVILQQALENYGCQVAMDEHTLESTLGNVQVAFQRQENETISALFHKEIEPTDAQEFIGNIYDEYTRVIQQKTYEKLLERAQNEGLVLETENRNEEDTIVLTFQVKE